MPSKLINYIIISKFGKMKFASYMVNMALGLLLHLENM